MPEFEYHLFSDVENFWQNRRFYHEGYETRNGQNVRAEIRVRNYRSRIMKVDVIPVLPRSWRADPDVLRFEVPSEGKAVCPFQVRVRESSHGNSPRLAICAEVTVDGRHPGQIAEAIINLERG